MKRHLLVAGSALLLSQWIAVGVAAEQLGRLFYTPAEREAFELARRYVPVDPEPEDTDPTLTITPEAVAPEDTEPMPMVTVDGYVRRSDGKATVWVNGSNSYDGDLSMSRVKTSKSMLDGEAVMMQQLDTHSMVRLKPGQTYDPNAGSVTDAYDPQKPEPDTKFH